MAVIGPEAGANCGVISYALGRSGSQGRSLEAIRKRLPGSCFRCNGSFRLLLIDERRPTVTLPNHGLSPVHQPYEGMSISTPPGSISQINNFNCNH